MPIELDLKAEFRVEGWRKLPEAFRDVLREKIVDQTFELYKKVQANVEGRILQVKTGQLAEKIRVSSRQEGNDYVGTVYVDNPGPKEFALEYGGKGYYFISPVVKNKLHFYWEKVGMEVWLDYVDHPPAQEYAYLRSALREVNLEQGFTTILDEAINRSGLNL